MYTHIYIYKYVAFWSAYVDHLNLMLCCDVDYMSGKVVSVMRLVKYVLLPALWYMLAQEEQEDEGGRLPGELTLVEPDGAATRTLWQERKGLVLQVLVIMHTVSRHHTYYVTSSCMRS